MSKTDWFFVAVHLAIGLFALAMGIKWIAREVGELMNGIDRFWRGFSRMFVGNDEW